MATDSLVNRKGPRPFELLPRDCWHACPACGAHFGSSEGLRSHRRFGRCSEQIQARDAGSNPDPVDEHGICEDELRRRVRRRLRALAALGDP